MKVAEFLCESQHNRDEEIQVSNYKFYTNRKNFDKPLKRRDGKIGYPVYERYSTKRIKKVYSISRETISSGGAHLSDDKNEVVDPGNVESPSLQMTKIKVSKINYKTSQRRNEKTKHMQLQTNNKSSEEKVININDYNKIVMVQNNKNTSVFNSGKHKRKRNSFSDTNFAQKIARPPKHQRDISPTRMKMEMIMNVEAPAESAGTDESAAAEGTGDECGCNTNNKQFGGPKCGCCKCIRPEPPRQLEETDEQFSCICTKGKERNSEVIEDGEENTNDAAEQASVETQNCSCVKRFQKISQDDGFKGYQNPSCKPCSVHPQCGGKTEDLLRERISEDSDCACIAYKEEVGDDNCDCGKNKQTDRRSSRRRSRRSSSKKVSMVGHSRSYESFSSGEKYKKTTFETKPYHSKMETSNGCDFRPNDYPDRRSTEEDCQYRWRRRRDANSNTDATDFFSSTGCFYSDSKCRGKSKKMVCPSNKKNKSTAAVQTYAYSPFSYSDMSVNVCQHCSSSFKQGRRQQSDDKWLCKECEDRICNRDEPESSCFCSRGASRPPPRRPPAKVSTSCQCAPQGGISNCMCTPKSNNTHTCRCDNKNESVQVIQCPSKCQPTPTTEKSKKKKKSAKSKKVTACECRPPVRDAGNTICMRSESSVSDHMLENAISSTVFHRRRKSKGCNIHAHVKMENQEIKHYEGDATIKKERSHIQQETSTSRRNKGKDVASSIKEILNLDPMKSVEIILPPKQQTSKDMTDQKLATSKHKQTNVRPKTATGIITSTNDLSNHCARQDCLFKSICKKPMKLWSSVGRNNDYGFKKKGIATGNRVTTVYNAATEGDKAAPPAEGEPPADGAAPSADGAANGANGAANGANGAANGANGAANGATNGAAKSEANGTANGAANGEAADKKADSKDKKKKEKKQKMDACLCKPPVPSCTCNCKSLAPEKAANCQCKTETECPNCDGSKRPKACDCSERIQSKEFQSQIRRERAIERKRERKRPKCKCTSEDKNDDWQGGHDNDGRYDRSDRYDRRNPEREFMPCGGSYDGGRRNQRNGYNDLYSRRSSTYDYHRNHGGTRSQASIKNNDRCGCSNGTHGFNGEERDYQRNEGAARSQSSMNSTDRCGCNVMQDLDDEWERVGARNMVEQRSSKRDTCCCCGGTRTETNNYGRNSYERDDYGREDYGRKDYGRNDYGRNDYNRNVDDCDRNGIEGNVGEDEDSCCPCKKETNKKKKKSFFSKFKFLKTVDCTGECKKGNGRNGRTEVYPVHTYSLIKVDEKIKSEKKLSENIANVQDVYNVHINVKMNKKFLSASKHCIAPLTAVNEKFRKLLLFVKDVIPEADKFLNGMEIENVPKSTASVQVIGQFGNEVKANRRSVRSATSPERNFY